MTKFSLVLSWLLILTLGGGNVLAQTNKQQEKETKLKQKIVEWGTNKNVTLKLKTGEKIEGRLAEIKDDLFTLQFVDKDKVTTRDIRYSDVDKIASKDGGKAGKIAGYTALGVLAGVGVTMLIILAVIANN
ncbi:MAG: hypothetical protein U0Y68_05585 [Blastocatellia bacterium]